MLDFIRDVWWRIGWVWEQIEVAFVEWRDSRSLSRLIAGVPALLLGIAVVAFAILGQLGGDERLLAHYSRLFFDALDDNDASVTELWARKLALLAPSTDDAVFGQAWLARRRGDPVAAAKLIRQLAPDDKTGYARAHLWRAKSLLQQGEDEVVDTSVVVHHLRQALRESSQRHVARRMLAGVFIASQDYPAAIEQLEALVSRLPELHWQLSQLYAVAGNQRRARSELELALEFYRDAGEQHPANSKLQIAWAQAEAAGGDLQRAEEILLAAVEREKGTEVRRALSSLYVTMETRLDQEHDPNMAGRLQLLERALRYTYDHPGALTRMGKLLHEDEAADEAHRALQEALARGSSPTLIHVLLGTAAAGKKDWKSAKFHLEHARKLDPQSPILLNNLAWVLASADPPEPELALQLVNAALKLSANHPEIRATRGRVLMLLERWPEALVEFELALPALQGRPSLHASVAEVYEQLSEAELAKKHRELAVVGGPAL